MAIKYPANVFGPLNGYSGDSLWTPQGQWKQVIGFVRPTSTLTTSFAVQIPSNQKGKDDTSGLVIPVGARITRLALRVPAGLVATNGDRLKLATAVGATGTKVFNNSASTAYVNTDVAASSTFAAENPKFELSPVDVTDITSQATANATGSAAIVTSARTFTLYVDNGTTGAGTGITVGTATEPIIVEAVYWVSNDVPRPDDISVLLAAPQ